MEIDPIKSTSASRRARLVRRQRMRDQDKPDQNALVPAGERIDHDAQPPEIYTPQLASFSAQLLSAPEPRGLKAGDVLRQSAKSAYLNTEWSGRDERRATPGQSGERDI